MAASSDHPTEPASPTKHERALVEGAIHDVRVRVPTNDDTELIAPTPGGSASGEPVSIDRACAIHGYEIVRKLHGGGQGVVYQAIQKSTSKKVAVKVIREGPFADPRNRMRLERGVRILSQLDHPNVVRIIDSGDVAGTLYYVMDYIPGRSLDEWLEQRRTDSSAEALQTTRRRLWSSRRRSLFSARRQASDIDEIVRAFIKICDAVSAAHVKGVIHRDLKPGNVRIDPNGVPHVLDFDLAKIVVGELDPEGQYAEMTQTGEFLGSLRWASPEQVERRPDRIDTRTDVYSLGVMLYEALVGQPPYPVYGTRRDLEDHILNTDPPRPKSLRRHIDEDLDAIILKCLSKPRERRYPSAATLGDDLRAFLAGAPVSARRDSTWYLLKKLARRHALAATALAAVVVTLVSALSISVHFSRKAAAAAMERAGVAEQALQLARQRQSDADMAGRQFHRMELGWFLLEWNAGRLDRARTIRDRAPADSPERLAMQFLLEPEYSVERFLTNLPVDNASMGQFIVGERCRSQGNPEAARRAYEAALYLPGPEMYKEAARARLEELANDPAAGDTSDADNQGR